MTSRKQHSLISEEEWKIREDLAACYRLFVHFGWTDLIFTHLSARVPGTDNQYLINPYGLLFDEITASNLIKVDFDGNVIWGDFPYNRAGHSIHSAILKARSDVNAVLHSHTRAGTAVSVMDEGLLPISQQASEVTGLLCYHDYDVARDNDEECRRLGNDIADKWLMIMRNHGLLSAGRTIGEAFYYLYELENACKIQVDVMGSGAKITLPNQSAINRIIAEGMPSREGPNSTVLTSWQALIRMLDRQGSNYKS
ncbi:MAG: hypothetical protein GKR95_20560 [Gammaproteobacteria bacterium]|nr:hypothetical protein [Gammaproteobacteria bacterium]